MGLISFLFYWAWIFSTFIGISLTFDLSSDESQIARIVGALGISLGLLLRFLSAPHMGKLGTRLFGFCVYALPLLLCAGVYLNSSFPLPLLALYLLFFFAGIGSAFMLGEIGAAFSTFDRKRAIINTCLASSIGGAVAFVISQIAAPVSIVVIACLMPLSRYLFRYVKAPVCSEEKGDRSSALNAILNYKPLLSAMFFYSFIFGFVVSTTESLQLDSSMLSLLLLVFVLPGIVLLLILLKLKKRVDVESLQRLLLASMILGLVPLLFLQGTNQLFCILLLALTFGIFDVANFVTLYEIIQENDLPRLPTFLIGRFLSELGIPLGWILGFLINRSALAEGNPQELVIALFAVCLTLWLATTGRGIMRNKQPQLSQDTSGAHYLPSYLLYFKDSLNKIAEHYHLSPREQEIFFMLAYGRTAKWIGEKLVISESTAKSHVYRIYQKMEIHSQQELLDIVEKSIGVIPGK